MERIYKENWEETYVNEHIIGVEMRNGNKYYLMPNCDGFVAVNLNVYQSNTDYADTSKLKEGFDQISALYGDKKVFEFNSMQEVVAWATS